MRYTSSAKMGGPSELPSARATPFSWRTGTVSPLLVVSARPKAQRLAILFQVELASGDKEERMTTRVVHIKFAFS